MSTASVYIHRVNCSHLLPLWETLQDQQVCLTQAHTKLLLLPWVWEHVRFLCVSIKSEVYFPQPSRTTGTKPCWPSNPNAVGACLPSAGPLGQGTRCGAQTSLSFGRYNY